LSASEFASWQECRTSVGFELRICPALRQERETVLLTFRWFRFATPPAKLHWAAGAQNQSIEFLFSQPRNISDEDVAAKVAQPAVVAQL